MSTSRQLASIACAAVAAFATYLPAHANLVTNGGFESTTNGANKQWESSNPDSGSNTHVTGWTSHNNNNNAYNFVYSSGSADAGGAAGQYGNVQLWGPANGSANGLPASSPDGGNYIAADGDFQNGTISQVINGLTVGQQYAVGFYFAYAQQQGFSGATVQHWSVSLGSNTQTLADYNLPNHGFSGWDHASLLFTATSASETLSFLAYGNVQLPPFALLDGVTMEAVSVPEPQSLALVGLALAGLIGAARVRRARLSVAERG